MITLFNYGDLQIVFSRCFLVTFLGKNFKSVAKNETFMKNVYENKLIFLHQEHSHLSLNGSIVLLLQVHICV